MWFFRNFALQKKIIMQGKKIDLIGKTFSRLTVLEKTDKRWDNSVVWKCVCDCGKNHFVNTKHLNNGNVRSCGCLLAESRGVSRPYKGEDLTGQIFGKLTVDKYSHVNRHNHRVWSCHCECGKKSDVGTAQLKSGKTASCGCMGYRSGNRRGALVYNYCGYEEITGTKWCSITSGAKSRNLEFNITKEMVWSVLLSQDNKCALSGLPISYENNTASVDRIDSALGYTPENIQLLHKDINRMKSNFNQEYFINICKLISAKH